ncbi:TetR/AcrR family transcriptional regulator [Pseudoalteromonas sp. SWYJ118]|uniref:TetR/AcrR family transcriptional regulator n=1 Tax=Pseudoalteromonas sp. SWYJ118 TaxID=2792062 RepID=UPI0018CDAEB7|nr:TetR/AcrR family transcriptional regulator [Pseudoalteromonas sp. SWYJ118]MBH0074756.1 TetR/AcrR family transcriptional regulator [Pseudoalteromonas sp. SWYJ118]
MNKREQIITTALNLFYSKGLHAVGINEILAVSGIAKKTLYNHFASKDELILACLATRDKNFNNWLEQVCEKQSALDVANGLFKGLTSWFNSAVPELGDFNGCFFINAAAEYPLAAHTIAIQCKAHKQAVLKIILNALLATPQLKNNKAKAENVAQTLFILKEGLICQARVMHTQPLIMPSTALLKHIIQS